MCRRSVLETEKVSGWTGDLDAKKEVRNGSLDLPRLGKKLTQYFWSLSPFAPARERSIPIASQASTTVKEAKEDEAAKETPRPTLGNAAGSEEARKAKTAKAKVKEKEAARANRKVKARTGKVKEIKVKAKATKAEASQTVAKAYAST